MDNPKLWIVWRSPSEIWKGSLLVVANDAEQAMRVAKAHEPDQEFAEARVAWNPALSRAAHVVYNDELR